MKIVVSREAAQELEEAAAWYEGEQSGLGERLIMLFNFFESLIRR